MLFRSASGLSPHLNYSFSNLRAFLGLALECCLSVRVVVVGWKGIDSRNWERKIGNKKKEREKKFEDIS